MLKKQIFLFIILSLTAAIFSACCGAQCRLDRQDVENQYLINGSVKETEEAAQKMLAVEGFRPYLDYEKPLFSEGYAIVTGKLAADRPGNVYVSANLRYVIKKSDKQDIKRADLTKTIIIKGRWDTEGEKLLDNECGIISTLEFTARDVSGTVVDSWVKNNEEPERSKFGKKLQKMIDKLRKEKPEGTIRKSQKN